jgi:hypothetical protein
MQLKTILNYLTLVYQIDEGSSPGGQIFQGARKKLFRTIGFIQFRLPVSPLEALPNNPQESFSLSLTPTKKLKDSWYH